MPVRARTGGASTYQLALGPLRTELVLEKPSGQTKLARNELADRYLHLDATGSIGAVSDASGTVAAIEYRSYGDVRSLGATAQDARHRFKEKETDESLLTYFGARYYDSRLARWMSRDPHALSSPDLILASGTQGANLYSFADNNPIVRLDRDGRNAVAVAKALLENPVTRAAIVAGVVALATWSVQSELPHTDTDALELQLFTAFAKLGVMLMPRRQNRPRPFYLRP